MNIDINAASETSGAAMRRKKREFENSAKEGAKLLVTDGEWELWTPETFEASVYLARKGVSRDDWARWDTAYEGNGSRYFDLYTKKGPLYIFINKSNPKEKYQYHAETDSFYDQYDRQSDFDSFICAHPAFADYFGIECDEDVEACGDINCATKYGANMCSIGASTESYPYYIDKTGAFDGYWDDQTDVLSVSQLQSIYDTLVSDGDIPATSFDEWLQSNVAAGLLSGCLMSDAQRCDMPADFGGYRDDDDIEYFSDDEVFRVIINDDPAYVEKILDECSCWYDYDDGDRLMVNMCGLNCLEDNGIDYDEV